jgi:Ribonuclease G/E
MIPLVVFKLMMKSCTTKQRITQEIAPSKQSIVKFYQSKDTLFEKYNIERQIKTSFGKTVSMSKGVSYYRTH